MEIENNLNPKHRIILTGMDIHQMDKNIKTWSEERKELRNEIWLNHGHYHLHDDPTSEGCEECWGRFNEESEKRKCDIKDLEEIYGDVSEEDFKYLKVKVNEYMDEHLRRLVVEDTIKRYL
jgi:hypothetical protein